MKVFNLTDIGTPELVARGWVNLPLVIGTALVAPGEEMQVVDIESVRRDISCFTGPGALSVGSRPPEYLVAKAQRANAERLAANEKAVTDRRKEK